VLLRSISVERFRNIVEARVEPHPHFNVIEGDNGQGKTNLLEALGVLASLKSFRGARNRDLIADGADEATLRCRLLREGIERDIRIDVIPRGRRVFLHDKPVRQLAEVYGLLNLVSFVPEDVAIVRGAPAERRLFADRMIFSAQPAYADEASAFEDALRQRNAVLRDERPDRGLARAFESELLRHGVTVAMRRQRYAHRLAPVLARTFSEIFDEGLPLEAQWEGELLDPISAAGGVVTEEALHAAWSERLDRTWQADVGRGFTGTGPHRDDLRLLLDGRDARVYASQGQQRAIVLALKISEIRLLEQQLGHAPVLLLDDVSSELDARRNERLFGFLASFDGQVFISTTDVNHIRLHRPFERWHMVGGALTPRSTAP
jgi:DNA replication and repair protein RecF